MRIQGPIKPPPQGGRPVPKRISLNQVYRGLRRSYGHQGWWPVINPKTLKGEYRGGAPRNSAQVFEIMTGAILTQSVSWKNVDTALGNLKRVGGLNPEVMRDMAARDLALLIRPAGYYNQKAVKLKNLLEWYAGYGFAPGKLAKRETAPLREELLSVNGIGPETADSILLYALNRKVFVVDAYTRRIFTRLGFLDGSEKYDQIQKLFHEKFRGDTADYNEYHALIVRHGKDFCRAKPLCGSCELSSRCVNSLT